MCWIPFCLSGGIVPVDAGAVAVIGALETILDLRNFVHGTTKEILCDSAEINDIKPRMLGT